MKLILILLVTIATSYARKSPHGAAFLKKYLLRRVYVPKEIIDDTLQDVVDIVKRYGYPMEEHTLKTEDNYSITLFRIPHDKSSTCETRTPIFLMHGMYGSAATWIIQGPGSALAYILADNCFDVWIGNSRGTYVSRGNKKRDNKFWDFSYHEIGYYDVPTMIDFILKHTNKNKLHCIGHSQGTTALFVLTSTRPEYNDKISSISAMAPVAYMDNVTNVVFLTIGDFARNKTIFETYMGNGEFVPEFGWLAENAKRFCDEKKDYFPICENFYFQLGGIDPEAINKTLLPVYMGHEPGGGSSNEILHHIQDMHSHSFRQFDHGVEKNMKIYNSQEPPSYDLKKVTAPVLLYYSYNDTLAVKTSVLRLSKAISNLQKLELIPHIPFNHLDYVYNIDAKNIIYKDLIKDIKKFD